MAKINTPIPLLKLNDGNSMPMLAYGCGTAWYKRAAESQVDEDLIDSIKKAVELEYYHLDLAEMYKTEPDVGKALKASNVDRNKLFVSTKAKEGIADLPGALRASLKKLQLTYVDLFLIHIPWSAKSDEELVTQWKSMEQLQKDGLTKSIGVSNYLPQHLEVILKDCEIPPAVNQIEFHPYLQHESSNLLEYHKRHHIATVAYAPLTPITKAAPGPLDEYLEQLAKKYAVHPAEILLRWCIDQDVATVTTTSKAQRMSDYLRCATFKLTPKEIHQICEVGLQKHYRGFWVKMFQENDWS